MQSRTGIVTTCRRFHDEIRRTPALAFIDLISAEIKHQLAAAFQFDPNVREAVLNTFDGGLRRPVTADIRDLRDAKIADNILGCRHAKPKCSMSLGDFFSAIYDICFCFPPSDDRVQILTIALDMIYQAMESY